MPGELLLGEPLLGELLLGEPLFVVVIAWR